MFGPLCAFPITPLAGVEVQEEGVVSLVRRAVDGGADSVCVLGSTGGYPYLTRSQRRRVAELAVGAAGDVPVLVGAGALSTRAVLEVVQDAQRAGVSGVLLAPLSYQPLTDDEVFGLYADVTRELSVPLCVYDNPTTTHVRFSDALHARIAELPLVRSVKLPGVPADPAAARDRVAALRALLPASVSLGVSGDAHAVRGLQAGCDVWYSVLAGTLPVVCRELLAPDADDSRLLPLWDLFSRYGSLRVVTAMTLALGLVARADLPRPVRELPEAGRRELAAVLAALPVG
ncbi:dihydrodipicolinate synthase family protein [Kineococcus sp. SYSU DK003]|uniref:dihydrodipicolinate synthase family protein n=1 Tax=Kineococcus sp. SYSU DK003 TaxID=3383124 RepID=UPI003D7E38BA